MFKQILLFISLSLLNFNAFSQDIPQAKGYVAYQVTERPIVDGLLDETSWQAADWSDPFLDIQGAHLPTPTQLTQMKMLVHRSQTV